VIFLRSKKLPKIFYVNWFRRAKDGSFLWPGYGENSRILKWAIERIEGEADAIETPLGFAPAAGSIDVAGLAVSAESMADALHVDKSEWQEELPLIEEWFKKIGEKLPQEMQVEFEKLKGGVR
jgi:phosphoenolpyruvate carboxykinase (GTP)